MYKATNTEYFRLVCLDAISIECNVKGSADAYGHFGLAWVRARRLCLSSAFFLSRTKRARASAGADIKTLTHVSTFRRKVKYLKRRQDNIPLPGLIERETVSA